MEGGLTGGGIAAIIIVIIVFIAFGALCFNDAALRYAAGVLTNCVRVVRGWAPNEFLPAAAAATAADSVTGNPINKDLGSRSRWAVALVKSEEKPPERKRDGPNINLSPRSQWAVELVTKRMELEEKSGGGSSLA